MCSWFYQWYTNDVQGSTDGTNGNTIGTNGNVNGTIGAPIGKPMVPLATNGTIGKISNGTIGRTPNRPIMISGIVGKLRFLGRMRLARWHNSSRTTCSLVNTE